MPVLELQYADETGTKGALTVKYPIGTTVAVLDAQAIALASFIAPITGCVLVRQRIIYKAVQIPKPSPIAGSDVKRQGVFIFDDEPDENIVLVAVPGLLDTKLQTTGAGSGILIDTDDSDVIAFLDAFVASGMTNPFAIECYDLTAAYRQSRA